MTPEEIRKLVSAKKYWSGSSKFLAVDKDEVLWYYGDEKMYCINKFAIDNGEVEFSPMPHQSFQ